MFDLSPIKIMLVVTVVLVLLGPDKLPEVARKIGAFWRTVKNFQTKVETEVREAIPQLPNTGDISRMVRSPIGLLNQLADRAKSSDEGAGVSEPGAVVSQPETVFVRHTSALDSSDQAIESSPISDPSLN